MKMLGQKKKNVEKIGRGREEEKIYVTFAFGLLSSLYVYWPIIYFLYRKELEGKKKEKKKSSQRSRVHVVPWCPSARMLGGSSLESLWHLESLRPRKKRGGDPERKERRKTGESIFGQEPLCVLQLARHQMKMRTNTHIFTVQTRRRDIRVYTVYIKATEWCRDK